MHDLNRLNKRLAERDEQVAKLKRLLEQKDQTIAELGQSTRSSTRRTTSKAVKTVLSTTRKHDWQY